MFLLPTPAWVLMTVTTGLTLLVVQPSGSARVISVSMLAAMVIAGISAGLAEAHRAPEDGPETNSLPGARGPVTASAVSEETHPPPTEQQQPGLPPGRVRVLTAPDRVPS